MTVHVSLLAALPGGINSLGTVRLKIFVLLPASGRKLLLKETKGASEKTHLRKRWESIDYLNKLANNHLLRLEISYSLT